MQAVYFLAGIIAGLAIGWYLTRLHYEGKKDQKGQPDNQDQIN
ncbi:MAG TPA: hypothetical protein P5338_11285 [Bacteroidales bacterium]|nr:hypothetical protein [Bacteroidales bacterium]